MAEAARTTADGDVLLTGATGFFGAFLLVELLAEHDRLICLVRARDEGHARERIRQNLVRYHRWDPSYADRIEVVIGDLTEPRLGLSEEALGRLADSIGTVLHNAAAVNHLMSYRHLHDANVASTQALLDLARTGRPKAFHFTSTNAVVEGQATGYVESKREAERLITRATADGVPTTIYRLPRLAPDSCTGVPNGNDVTVRLLDLILQLGRAPDAAVSEIWIAVDVAAATIVRTTGDRIGGEVLALWAPERTSLRYLLEVAAEVGFVVELEPLEQWARRVQALSWTDSDVVLGILGIDGATVPRPDPDRADGYEGAALLAAPQISREALRRFFHHRKAGF